MSSAMRRVTCNSRSWRPRKARRPRSRSTRHCKRVRVLPSAQRSPMPELLRRPREPEPETTAPIDVKLRSVALVIVASTSAVALLYWAREVFIPIVLSVLIAYALEPLVAALIRLHLPRVIASALVIITLTGGVAYTGYALSDDAIAMVSELPDAAARLRVALRPGRNKPGTIQQVQKAAAELQKTADEASGQNPVGAGVQRVQIEAPAIVVFFVFFLLAAGDLFKRKVVKLAGPSLEKKKITIQILNEIDSQIEKF